MGYYSSFYRDIHATFTRIKDGKFLEQPVKKVIKVRIENGLINKPTLRFIGGPTGHESYYLEDLTHSEYGLKARKQQNPLETDFYLCWGCNRYSRCSVPVDKLIEFIDDAIAKIGSNLLVSS